MSITNPNRLIQLMGELVDMIGKWNIRTNSSINHIESLKVENTEVHSQTESKYKRAVAVEELDFTTTHDLLSESDSLCKMAEKVMDVVDKLPPEMEKRLLIANSNYERWSDYSEKSYKWNTNAVRDFKRAIKEYNIAVDVYNRALEDLNRAIKRLNSCRRSQTKDRDGRISPSCSSEYSDHTDANAKFKVAEQDYRHKEEIRNRAEYQFDLSEKAVALVSNTMPNVKRCIKLSEEACDCAQISYRAGCDFVSSSSSAYKLSRDGVNLNSNQKEFNEKSRVEFKRAEEDLARSISAISNMISLSESCNSLNTLVNAELEYKQDILNKMSSIDIDIRIPNLGI